MCMCVRVSRRRPVSTWRGGTPREPVQHEGSPCWWHAAAQGPQRRCVHVRRGLPPAAPSRGQAELCTAPKQLHSRCTLPGPSRFPALPCTPCSTASRINRTGALWRSLKTRPGPGPKGERRRRACPRNITPTTPKPAQGAALKDFWHMQCAILTVLACSPARPGGRAARRERPSAASASTAFCRTCSQARQRSVREIAL